MEGRWKREGERVRREESIKRSQSDKSCEQSKEVALLTLFLVLSEDRGDRMNEFFTQSLVLFFWLQINVGNCDIE